MLLDKELLIGIFSNTPNDVVWNGLGSNNNFSTALNWRNNSRPINFDRVAFEGTARLAPLNDLTGDTRFTGIFFNEGAGAFTLSGNRFILHTDSITNNSSNTQTINNDIVLGSDAGTINCATSSININGIISGNGSLTKIGTSTLSLSGNNTYTGSTYISAGAISVLNDNVFGTGTVNISSTGIVVPSTSPQVLTVINNPINILNTPTGSSIATNKNTQYKGLITSNGPANSVCKISVGNNATATYTGGLSSTGATNLTIFDGTGTHIISSVPVLSNSVFQFQANRPYTMIIAVSGNRMNIFKTNSNVLLTVPFAINNTGSCIFGYSNSPARIALSGDQIFTNMGIQAGTSFAESSGNNIFNNTSTFVNLTANNITGSSINTYVGSISGNINLIKTGTGTLTHSGSTDLGVGPRYTGFTAISAGTLINYALSSNPGNKVNYAQFTNTSLTINFSIAPIAGDSFILLPGRTINQYQSTTLLNGNNKVGVYSSTNSTLFLVNSTVQLGSNIFTPTANLRNGTSVSINDDGTRVAIGSPTVSSSISAGLVQVYQWSGGTSTGGVWSKLGSDILGENPGDISGSSVSLNAAGTIVAIGAENNDGNLTSSGHVRVYEWSGGLGTSGSWIQLGSDIDGEATMNWSGGAVSLNAAGTRLAIGAIGNNNNTGHVRVYYWPGGGPSWIQLGTDIDGQATSNLTGYSVSFNDDGTRLAIGETGTIKGRVRIFYWSGGLGNTGSWIQLGSDIDGEYFFESNGSSVSLNASGTRLAIGARLNSSTGGSSGQVRIYEWSGGSGNTGSWTQMGVDINGEGIYDYMGTSVSMNSVGDRVAIGAPGNDQSGQTTAQDAGQLRVYEWNGAAWRQIISDIDGVAAFNLNGESVSLNAAGNRVIVGAPDNSQGGAQSGHSRVFQIL